MGRSVGEVDVQRWRPLRRWGSGGRWPSPRAGPSRGPRIEVVASSQFGRGEDFAAWRVVDGWAHRAVVRGRARERPGSDGWS